MGLFNRNIPSKVMAGEEIETRQTPAIAPSGPTPRASAPTAPQPKPKTAESKPQTATTPTLKEKDMAEQPKSRDSLLDIQPQKRGLGPAERSQPSGAPPHAGGTADTYIGNDTVIEGKILAQGEVSIDGTFKGEIVSNNHVKVGKSGKLEGTIEAKSMLISGQVIGNLHILERLELQETAELYGDLETQPGALIIEKGARVEGRFTMGLAQGKSKSPQAEDTKSPGKKTT